MIRRAAQDRTIALVDARLSHSGDWVGNDPSTARVAKREQPDSDRDPDTALTTSVA